MAQSARAVALKFLKIRLRSIEELRGKLKGKGFCGEDIEAAVAYLTELGLLDDRVLTEAWIRCRLTRSFGFSRITRELREKGVAKEIIVQAITKAKGEYVESDIALAVARRRWERDPGIDPQKKKKRLFDFLLRRGFSMDGAMKAIKELK